MADDSTTIAINGVVSETEADQDDTVSEAKLRQRIESLEKEKRALVEDNEEVKLRVKKMTEEIESLRSDGAEKEWRIEAMEAEIEEADERKRALDAIAARAVELETDVPRLQHDLVTAMAEGEEASKEAAEMKALLEEKEVRIGEMERGRDAAEERVRVLEQEVRVLEGKVEEAKSARGRTESETREKVDESERMLSACKKKVEELEKEVGELRESEEKARILELKVVELEKEVKGRGLGPKTLNGIKVDGWERGVNSQWSVIALGSAGAVVTAVAVVYLFYAKRR